MIKRWEELVKIRSQAFEESRTSDPVVAYFAFGLGSEHKPPTEELEHKRDDLLRMHEKLERTKNNLTRARILYGIDDTELSIRNMDTDKKLRSPVIKGIYSKSDLRKFRQYFSGCHHPDGIFPESRSITNSTSIGWFGDYSNDPVHNMLKEMWRSFSERPSFGEIIAIKIDGKEQPAYEVANMLMQQIEDRQMTKETYMSILEGTHPLVRTFYLCRIDYGLGIGPDNTKDLIKEQKAY